MTPKDKDALHVAPTGGDSTTEDRRTGRDGFTIIEVMISIMILAVSVVSIFGAQFATVATVGFSRYTTQAIALARCRMSEIELEVQVENGFEIGDVTSRGECCELLENHASEFTCSWEIKTLEIPDIMSLMAAQDGGVGMSGGLGVEDSMEDMGMMGGVASFLPMLSDLLGQAIRRVTVTVEWTQGRRKRDFVLSQFLVHPTQGPLQLMNSAADAMDRQEILEDSQSTPSAAGASPFPLGKK